MLYNEIISYTIESDNNDNEMMRKESDVELMLMPTGLCWTINATRELASIWR